MPTHFSNPSHAPKNLFKVFLIILKHNIRTWSQIQGFCPFWTHQSPITHVKSQYPIWCMNSTRLSFLGYEVFWVSCNFETASFGPLIVSKYKQDNTALPFYLQDNSFYSMLFILTSDAHSCHEGYTAGKIDKAALWWVPINTSFIHVANGLLSVAEKNTSCQY